MKQNRGFLLLEALLAVVVLSMVVFSLFSMVGFLQRKTTSSSFESRAALLVQEGTEIAHTFLLSNWSIADGAYAPVFVADNNSWELEAGADTELESLYTRVIHVSRVCRNPNNGDIIDEGKTSCSGVIDPYLRRITTEVEWPERAEKKTIKASLLVLNLSE